MEYKNLRNMFTEYAFNRFIDEYLILIVLGLFVLFGTILTFFYLKAKKQRKLNPRPRKLNPSPKKSDLNPSLTFESDGSSKLYSYERNSIYQINFRDFRNYDMALIEEKLLEKENSEELAWIIYQIWESSELFYYDSSLKKGYCNQCPSIKGIDVPLNIMKDRVMCPSCKRVIRFSDFENTGFDGEKKVNKVVLKIGKYLWENRRTKGMEDVIKKFVSKGGRGQDLSSSWDRIGGWIS